MDKITIKLDRFIWIIPTFIILIYNLAFLNRFYPITEGWFSTYAWFFNHGQFPYRDFYFFLTPLYLIIMGVFTTLFGYDFIYLRIFGLIIVLLMTFFLYKNFEIIFGSAVASFVTIVGIIYYQSNNAHITYDFIQFVTLFGLVQSFLLLKYIDGSGNNIKAKTIWLFLAGVFASLAFLTKQSNGFMITVFSFTGLLLISLSKGFKEGLRVSLLYIGGFAIPVVLTVLWLLANSALFKFIEQVLTGSVEAKGGIDKIFFSWFQGILTENFAARLWEILFIMLVFGYWIYIFIRKKKENKIINNLLLLIPSIILLIVVFLPFLINKTHVYELAILGHRGIDNIIVAAISIPLLSIIICIVLFILKKPNNNYIFLFSFVSLGYIYGTGTSAGITEVGAFAGFCLFTGIMLYYRSIFLLGKVFIVLFCLSFCLMLVEIKYERPYFWWNATSPDIRTNLASADSIKLLKGMYTSENNIKMIKEITAEIQANSKPKDTILLFPNIPVFYLFTERNPPGKAIVHWFDFLPDNLAIKEAELIRKYPPKVIVYLDLGTIVWEAHERLFRDNKPSGQRKVDKVIMDIIKSKKMHISKKFVLSKDAQINIWRN